MTIEQKENLQGKIIRLLGIVHSLLSQSDAVGWNIRDPNYRRAIQALDNPNPKYEELIVALDGLLTIIFDMSPGPIEDKYLQAAVNLVAGAMLKFRELPTGNDPYADISLREARTRVFTSLRWGTTCPCCDRKVSLYNRNIYRSIAVSLMAILALHKRGLAAPTSLEIKNEVESRFGGNEAHPTGGIGKAALWGLVETTGATDEKSSQWRLTQAGRDYAFRERKIAKTLGVYRNIPMSASKDEVDINFALRTGFDYETLMEEAT